MLRSDTVYICVCIHHVCMCVYMFRSVHASIVCVCVWGGGGGMKLKECVCEREKVYIFVCQRGGERERILISTSQTNAADTAFNTIKITTIKQKNACNTNSSFGMQFINSLIIRLVCPNYGTVAHTLFQDPQQNDQHSHRCP